MKNVNCPICNHNLNNNNAGIIEDVEENFFANFNRRGNAPQPPQSAGIKTTVIYACPKCNISFSIVENKKALRKKELIEFALFVDCKYNELKEQIEQFNDLWDEKITIDNLIAMGALK